MLRFSEITAVKCSASNGNSKQIDRHVEDFPGTPRNRIEEEDARLVNEEGKY